eukprot:18636-Heterococcus_DN1.PRE.1
MKTRYIARTKIPGVPHHAKAGNLNNCILQEGSSGQLIIILDCDMLPEPCMARTVAPFFFKKLPLDAAGGERRGPVDEGGLDPAGKPAVRAQLDMTVGLLQTPQAFYNLDSHDLLGQVSLYATVAQSVTQSTDVLHPLTVCLKAAMRATIRSDTSQCTQITATACVDEYTRSWSSACIVALAHQQWFNFYYWCSHPIHTVLTPPNCRLVSIRNNYCLRRYALEKVGGFSTGSITEDFKTSLNLCANGFVCKYFLQRMTRGVSPKELDAFMVQHTVYQQQLRHCEVCSLLLRTAA